MKILKTISWVMLFVFLTKVAGLMRNILIMRGLGADSPEAAAFHFASIVPRHFMDFAFAAAISAAFIPVYNRYLKAAPRDTADRLANNFNTAISLFSAGLMALGMVFAYFISGLFIESGYVATLAAPLLSVMLITVLTTTLTFSLTAILQSLGAFNMPAIMSLFSNLVVIAYLLFMELSPMGLAIAFVVGSGMQALLLIPALKRMGFRLKFVFDLKDEGLKAVFKMTPLVMLSSWLLPLNNLVNIRVIGQYSYAAIGQIEAANNLYIVVTGFVALSIANVLFPKLSKEAAADKAAFSKTLSSAINGMLFILIPMSAGLWLLAAPLVRFLYLGGAFSVEAAHGAGAALSFLALGMVGFGLWSLISRAFFALMDTKTPLLLSLAAIVINIVVVLAIISPMGVRAPAISAAASISFMGIALYAAMSRQLPTLRGRPLILNIVKMLVSSALMLLALKFVNNWLELSDLMSLLILGVLGLAIYLASAYILRIKLNGKHF